ncbi:MAG: patatin-like phospholipase family protein [Microscillaceae bacterium]|jgi:NTE family protein|nr:patatin-like phospholipase family protein [Microscillaceae bacterium]
MQIGVTLSGGGARGIAHLGVLEALEELGVYPNRLAGVSAGAMVGAMYAQGYAPRKILEIISDLKLSDFFRPSPFKMPGIFNLEKMTALLLKYLPHNSFNQLKIPLTISATEVNLGELVYFSEGELIKPILASCCVPVMFSPIQFEGKMLIDGGVINSMVVEPLEADCQLIIGVHTNPFDKNQPIKSTRSLMARCFNLVMHSNARANFSRCDLVIEPIDLKNITPFKLGKAEEIFQIGYDYTKSMKKEVLQLKAQAADGASLM